MLKLNECIPILFMMLSLFFVLRPSRSITNIYVPKIGTPIPKDIPNYKNLVIVECGRFFGTAPTYYIFDGKEEDRILAALGQLEHNHFTGY